MSDICVNPQICGLYAAYALYLPPPLKQNSIEQKILPWQMLHAHNCYQAHPLINQKDLVYVSLHV